MRVTVDQLADLGMQLGSMCASAEADVASRLTALWQGARSMPLSQSVPTMRDAAAAAIADAENQWGAGSAAIGANMLSMTMDSGDVPKPGFDGLEIADRYADSQSARYWAKFLDGTDEGFDKFLAGVLAKTRRQVGHAADREVAMSCAKMGKTNRGVRFARVPSGPSCGFCIMLASRGFVYATRESAGEFTKFHDGCDCRVIGGMDGIEVEGYDPGGLYERYAKCVRAVNGGAMGSSSGAVWDDWQRLTPEEQARYGKRARKGADAFNAYFERRVCAEMDTRDREWLWSGIPSSVPTIAEGATPDEWELRVADILWDNGLSVSFQPRSLSLNDRRADTLIDGVKWEIKNPKGNSTMTAFNQFKSAIFGKNKRVRNPQAENLIISNVRSIISASELIRQAREVMAGGEFPEIKNVLVADAENDAIYRVGA